MKQNYSTVSSKNVAPGQTSPDLRLGPGKWCMSSLCTVPYVEVLSDDYAKTFSWGEYINIPDGRTGLVKNVSAHQGDIFLNSGWDYSTKPKRVTIPVPLLVAPPGTFNFEPFIAPTQPPAGSLITTKFPVDTRLARQAFLVINWLDNEGEFDTDFFCVGCPDIHSVNTYNLPGNLLPSVFPVPKNGYINTFGIAPTVQGAYIPLGFMAAISDNTLPHVLLDKAYVFWSFYGPGEGAVVFNPAAYYILEY